MRPCARPVAHSRIDHIPKQLHAEYRLQHGPHRGGEHVRDGRGDLDGQHAGDADEEADDALGQESAVVRLEMPREARCGMREVGGQSQEAILRGRSQDASPKRPAARRRSQEASRQTAVRRSTSHIDSDNDVAQSGSGSGSGSETVAPWL